MSELAIAKQAADVGGELLAKYFRDGVTVQQKEGEAAFNLVSKADIEAEHAIVDVIHRQFPDHAILGEESHDGSADAEHLWIVDPLDGTTNFAHGIPHFAISIAYYRAGQAVCGVILNPIRGDLYIAEQGGGATHNGQPARVSPEMELEKVLISVGFYYDRGAMMEATLAAIGDLFRRQIRGVRRFGTASLDLVQVGSGRFGAYFEYELSPWDYAAGRLFVEEAGGRATTAMGEALPLKSTSLLASNGTLHASVLDIVRRHHPNR